MGEFGQPLLSRLQNLVEMSPPPTPMCSCCVGVDPCQYSFLFFLFPFSFFPFFVGTNKKNLQIFLALLTFVASVSQIIKSYFLLVRKFEFSTFLSFIIIIIRTILSLYFFIQQILIELIINFFKRWDGTFNLFLFPSSYILFF